MKLDSDAAIEILKSSHDAIVIVNSDGDIVLANRVAEQLFGYGEGELVGEKVEVLMPAGFRGMHEKHRARYGAAPRSRPLVSGLSLKGQRRPGSDVRILQSA